MNTHHKILAAVDFDKWASKIYKLNFPNANVICGYVRDSILSLPSSDIILGGPPCQPFSNGGENEGEEDERDGIPDFIQAIAEKMPRMFLFENVDGILKPKHAKYFWWMIERLQSLGFTIQHRSLDAADFGVPQRRLRVWVWGIRNDVYASGVRHVWPTPTHTDPVLRSSLFAGDLPPWVTVGQAIGIRGELVRQRAASWGERRGHPDDDPAPTIMGGNGDGGSTGALYIRRRRAASVDRPLHSMDEPSPTITDVSAGGSAAGFDLVVMPRDSFPYKWSDKMLKCNPPAELDRPAPTIKAKLHKGGAEGLVAADEVMAKPSPTIQAGSHAGGPDPINNRKRERFWRRLSAEECARLQSVHDEFNWGDINKTNKYRIVGNGWACAMGHAFAQCFIKADPLSVTIVDLFCGGGLGAAGWHGLYWRLGNG